MDGEKYQAAESHEAWKIDLMAQNIDDEAVQVRDINMGTKAADELPGQAGLPSSTAPKQEMLPQDNERGKPKQPRAQF